MSVQNGGSGVPVPAVLNCVSIYRLRLLLFEFRLLLRLFRLLFLVEFLLVLRFEFLVFEERVVRARLPALLLL